MIQIEKLFRLLMFGHVFLAALPQFRHFDERRQEIQHDFRIVIRSAAGWIQQLLCASAECCPAGLMDQHGQGVGTARRRILDPSE